MGTGRYRLVAWLRSRGVPERHIRRTLHTELGLTAEEIDEAMSARHRLTRAVAGGNA
jgi:hypothetical protein